MRLYTIVKTDGSVTHVGSTNGAYLSVKENGDLFVRDHKTKQILMRFPCGEWTTIYNRRSARAQFSTAPGMVGSPI